MKTLALAKIAALAVTLSALFTFAACPTDGGGPGDGNYSNDRIEDGGSTLKLSGQVYTASMDQSNGNLIFTPYTGNMDISASCGGSGGITGGVFDYSIGVPGNLEPFFSNTHGGIMEMFGTFDYQSGFVPDYDYFKIESENVNINCYFLDGFSDGDLYDSSWTLTKANLTFRFNGNPPTLSTQNIKGVAYCYVDGDVTVRGTGKITEGTDDDNRAFSRTTTNLNLAFKTGWNAVYVNATTTYSETGVISKASLSLSNHNFRWVLFDDYWVDSGD